MPRKLTSKLKEDEFYCVSCRGRVKSNGGAICVEIYNNRRTGRSTPALRGQCAKCGTNLTKFIKTSSTSAMLNKYGAC